ncbi:hypothetical protein [Crenothrix sp.]|uniref:hypothetical protein n=1 Tax=Crenothrix sp. TaxID=3100433 RepID=UPI00374CDE61
MSRNIIMPTEEEDAEINAGIAADPDTVEWTDEDFANARSAYIESEAETQFKLRAARADAQQAKAILNKLNQHFEGVQQ